MSRERDRLKSEFNADVLLGVVVLLGAAAIIISSWQYPPRPWSLGGSPAVWPRALAAALGLFGILLLAGGLLRPVRVGLPNAAASVRMALLALLFFASQWMMQELGFLTAVAVLIGASMVILTERARFSPRFFLIVTGISVGTGSLLYAVLSHFARINLPTPGFF